MKKYQEWSDLSVAANPVWQGIQVILIFIAMSAEPGRAMSPLQAIKKQNEGSTDDDMKLPLGK